MEIRMKKKALWVLILNLLLCSVLSAQTNIAVLGFENLNGDPKYDYLGGMLLGITLFDLASDNDINLINRSDLEAVLHEQKLGLSGIVAGSPEAKEVGTLMGAEYLLKGEYATAKPKELMGKPYSRVIVLHIAIIAGGFFVMALGSPVPLLIVLIIGKIILDMKMHLREHRKAKPISEPVS